MQTPIEASSVSASSTGLSGGVPSQSSSLIVRPTLAALLSLIYPGLGQFYLGRWKRALAIGFVLVFTRFFVSAFSAEYSHMVIALIVGFLVLCATALDAFLLAKKMRDAGGRRALKSSLLLCYVLGFSILMALAKPFCRMEAFSDPAVSMSPTLVPGDSVYIDHWAYNSGGPQRGDIVVFRYPKDPKVIYMKRVIGLPGDKISYVQPSVDSSPASNSPVSANSANSTASLAASLESSASAVDALLVNGKPLTESYISTDGNGETPLTEFVVPADNYYLLGDNRSKSNDSRFWGSVSRDNILGKACFVFFNKKTLSLAPKNL